MKKIYLSGKRSKKLMTMSWTLLFSILGLFATAQETLVWNGSTDTDATNPLNWTPNASIFDNILQIDSAYKYTNSPVLSLSGSNAINQIIGTGTAVFTIDSAGTFLDINTKSLTYWSGTMILKAGNMSYRSNFYLEDSTALLDIQGGWFEVRASLLMGKKPSSGDYGPGGGQVKISGNGELHLRNAPFRFAEDTTQSVITMTDSATITVNGDWVAGATTLIARNQITSDDNHDPYAYYDANNVQTVVALRSKDSLFLDNTDLVQVFEGDPVPTIHAVQNRGLEELTSLEWKYATQSGGPYMSFDPAQTADSLVNASFTTAGSYYVVLEGVSTSGTIYSPEVQVNVTSKMVTLDPAGEQDIRVGYAGGMITATEKETATSREWKWTTTSGSDYQSFDPPVTSNEYTPDFMTDGIYYVVCQSVVGGITYTSPEVTVKMNPSAGQTIDWTGAYGVDAADVRNYSPMMTPFFQNLNIPVSSLDNPPVLTKAGNDTISSIAPADSAEFIIRKADTDSLYLSADPYLMGKIIIEGGVVVNKYYGRCEGNNSGWIVKNNGQLIINNSLIIGKSNGATGGQLTISDNGFVHIAGDSYGNAIWRFATDTTHSVITISDNGKLELVGDHTGDVADWMAKNQLMAPDGFKIQYEYNASDSVTVVTAKSDVAFDITPLTAQYVGVGQMGGELTTKNDASITSREWKYATTSGGDYMSFDPAATGATFKPSFDAAGIYYVVCVGSDGTDTYTSDEAQINVVDVSVTPADDQQIAVDGSGTTLTVTESMPPDSREWKYSTTSGSGYQSFIVAGISGSYTPLGQLFGGQGTYYVVCESKYGDQTITSNEVKVVVGDNTAVDDIAKENSVQVYPNPSTGKFYFNAKGMGAYSLKVFDMTGKAVYERNFRDAAGPQQFVLKNKGIYILNITSADKVKTSKIIVK